MKRIFAPDATSQVGSSMTQQTASASGAVETPVGDIGA